MVEVSSIGRATVGVVFLMAAVLKLRRPMSVAPALAAIGLPRVARAPAALGIAGIECLLGGLLIFTGDRASVIVAAGAVALFTALLAYLEARAPGARCGCLGEFGSGDHLMGIARNGLLLGLLVLALVSPARPDGLAVITAVQVALGIAIVPEGIQLVRRLRLQRLENGAQ